MPNPANNLPQPRSTLGQRVCPSADIWSVRPQSLNWNPSRCEGTRLSLNLQTRKNKPSGTSKSKGAKRSQKAETRKLKGEKNPVFPSTLSRNAHGSGARRLVEHRPLCLHAGSQQPEEEEEEEEAEQVWERRWRGQQAQSDRLLLANWETWEFLSLLQGLQVV